MTETDEGHGAGARLPFLLRRGVDVPWGIKRRVGTSPTLWRLWAGACRRLGWDETCLGWHTPVNGPFAGVRLEARHPNHLYVPMGLYEPVVMEWAANGVSEWARAGRRPSVWDVGANRGLFSLLAARCGAQGVVAIEPDPGNLRQLRRHLAANPELAEHIVAVEAAVADREGDGWLISRTDGAVSQMQRDDLPRWRGEPDDRVLPVRVLTLDTLLDEGFPPPSLVKIDVEGAEAAVLEGASRLLRQIRPHLLIEVHEADTAARVLVRLDEAGYRSFRLTAAGLDLIVDGVPLVAHVLAVPDGVAS